MAEETDSYDLQALHWFPCCSYEKEDSSRNKTVTVKMMKVL